MATQLTYPLQFIRQYAGNLDGDYSFETKQTMTDYLTSARRYAGQIAYCKEDDKIYIMSSDMSSWNELKGNNSSNSIKFVDNYSKLDKTLTDYEISYCLNDYTDTTVDPNVIYSKGLYLFDKTSWSLISTSGSSLDGAVIKEYKQNTEYKQNDYIINDGIIYQAYRDFTSTDIDTDRDYVWVSDGHGNSSKQPANLKSSVATYSEACNHNYKGDKIASAGSIYDLDREQIDYIDYFKDHKSMRFHRRDGITIDEVNLSQSMIDIANFIMYGKAEQCDEKPTVAEVEQPDGTKKWIATYKYNGTDKTIEAENVWFYYTVTDEEGNMTKMQTIFINGEAEDIQSGDGNGVNPGVDDIPLWKTNQNYYQTNIVYYNGKKYLCVKDHTSSTFFRNDVDYWVEILNRYYYVETKAKYEQMVNDGLVTKADKSLYIIGEDSSDEESSGSKLEEEITSNVEVGGVTANTTFAVGTKISDIIKAMLVKYYAPDVTFTINPSAVLYKVGDSISTLDMIVNATKKSNNIVSIKYYVGDTLVDTKDSTTDTDIANGGSYTYSYATAITSNITLKVIVNDGNKDVTKTINIKFINPMYFGYSDGTLTEILKEKVNYTTPSLTCDEKIIVFKYPKSYGQLTQILDPNGFDNINSFTVTEETINSVDYYVYTSGSITVSDFKFTFKF